MADVSLKIKSDFEQAEKDFQDLGSTSESTRQKIEKFSASFKTEQIDKFRDRNKLNAIAIKATQGAAAGMAAEAKGLQREIQRLISKGLSPEDEALKPLIKDYDKLNSEMQTVDKTTQKTTVSFASMVKGILGADIIRGVLYKIKDGLGSIITEAQKLEDAEAAFTPLMGGADRAKELVRELNIAAAETPFQFEGIQKSVSTLLPVMNGDIEKTIKTFKMLGDTAGGNQQKLESVTRGFTKAMLKGRVDMESLNMIAEAGVPIFNEMAESMGYGSENMTAFFKEISGGKVSTDEMVKAFQKMTSEGGIFFEGMIIASKTTSGVMSTLRDSIAMTAAGIGQAFLPYIKEIAIKITKVSTAILKWISDGDNLKNTLEILGYVLAGVTAGVTAFLIVSKGAVAIQALTAAFKGLTAAIAANPIGLIATVITAVLVPAIIWLIKNWDLVKYKVVDFGLAAREKMLSLGIAIREKVIGSLTALLDQLAKIPIIGKMFAKISDAEKKVTAQMQNGLETVKLLRAANKKNFEATQAEANKRIETAKNESGIIQGENDKIIKSNLSRADAFKKILEGMKESERVQQEELIVQAQEFFERRAEAEGNDYASRIEYLQEYLNKVKDMENISAQDRKALEEGITRAIQKQQKNRIQNAITFGQQMLTSTSELLTSLQTIFQNAGKSAYGLAVALKGISMAEAAINSYLAFDRVLASPALAALYPANLVAAGITLAAGLAKQVAIATTPIPSAQTGIDNYMVPDIPATRNDRAAIMASAGETVTVTPRGEESEKTMVVNIDVAGDTIFKVVQRGIDTGKINLNSKNIGRTRGVFAT